MSSEEFNGQIRESERFRRRLVDRESGKGKRERKKGY